MSSHGIHDYRVLFYTPRSFLLKKMKYACAAGADTLRLKPGNKKCFVFTAGSVEYHIFFVVVYFNWAAVPSVLVACVRVSCVSCVYVWVSDILCGFNNNIVEGRWCKMHAHYIFQIEFTNKAKNEEEDNKKKIQCPNFRLRAPEWGIRILRRGAQRNT